MVRIAVDVYAMIGIDSNSGYWWQNWQSDNRWLDKRRSTDRKKENRRKEKKTKSVKRKSPLTTSSLCFRSSLTPAIWCLTRSCSFFSVIGSWFNTLEALGTLLGIPRATEQIAKVIIKVADHMLKQFKSNWINLNFFKDISFILAEWNHSERGLWYFLNWGVSAKKLIVHYMLIKDNILMH